MPRPRNPNIDRWQWPGVPGYVYPLQQKGCSQPYVYHKYKSHRKSFQIPWNPELKSVVRKMHVAWIEEMILKDAGLVAEKKVEKKGVPQSFLTAATAYKNATSHRLPKGTLQKLNQALTAHFETDIPLDYTTIHDHLVSVLSSSKYATSTLRKHLIALKGVCRYCVEREWLSRNPIDLIGIPKEPTKDDVAVWTRKEVASICDWLRTKSESPHAEWYALFIEWMSLTSMRPGEIRNMQLRHIERDRLRIPKTKTGVARGLPIVNPKDLRRKHPNRAAWQKRLQQILAELKELYKQRERMLKSAPTTSWNRDHLWPFANTDKLNRAFQKATKELELRKGRMYDLRATAEDYWVWDLGFGLDQICEYAGHNPSVYIKYYKRRYGSDEHRRLLHM